MWILKMFGGYSVLVCGVFPEPTDDSVGKQDEGQKLLVRSGEPIHKTLPKGRKKRNKRL